MTAADLIQWLSRHDPKTPVLLGDGFRVPLPPEKATAVLDGDGDWHQDGPDAPEGMRCEVVVLW